MCMCYSKDQESLSLVSQALALHVTRVIFDSVKGDGDIVTTSDMVKNLVEGSEELLCTC